MIARWLGREFREFPATSTLCLAWVVVFGAMTYHQLAEGSPLPASRWLVFGFGGGDAFGDLTLNDLARGQAWRSITCNFIHYSVIHLGLNLLALYQLGSVVESWYGPYQTIFLFGLTGAGGNLLSAMARLWLRSNREVHSAGGSVAIMGIVGLCAVVGLRSGHAEGRRLGRLMLVFIGLTAALGAVFVKYIDNWGHGGGLLVGVALGLAHRWLRARVGRPTAWGAGALTLLAIAGSAAAQYASERREGPARLERKLVRRSNYLARASTELAWLRRPDPPRVHLLAGYDLRLMSWGDGSAVPTSGRNLVIVGTDNNGLLHIRIFDASGNAVTNTDETKLPATHAGAISALKQRLPGLLPPHVLTGAEKAQLASEATSIVDPTLLVASKWLDYLDEELDRQGRAEVAALRPMIAEAMEDPPDEERRRAIDEHLTRLLALMRQKYDDDRRRLRELRGHPRPPGPGKDRMAN